MHDDKPVIRLRKDMIFKEPEVRIREYCEVEIYQGYDDKHNVNDTISREDIDAANNLYAMIDRYDDTESERLLNCSKKISETLSQIPNTDIFAIPEKEWFDVKRNIKSTLEQLLSVRGIGLAKATKMLHLKRPNLFPVLDSFVVKFLLGIDTTGAEKNRQLEIGLEAMELIRAVTAEQKEAFEKLLERTSDLPFPLTPVRMFDILCWTTEKWDVRNKHNAPYGTPHKSLLDSYNSTEPVSPTTREIRKAEGRYVVFEDYERATGPKIHSIDCTYYQRWLKRKTTTTTWHGPYVSEEKAWQICRDIASKQHLSPSRHNCLKQMDIP